MADPILTTPLVGSRPARAPQYITALAGEPQHKVESLRSLFFSTTVKE